jgi:hypothetical protein
MLWQTPSLVMHGTIMTGHRYALFWLITQPKQTLTPTVNEYDTAQFYAIYYTLVMTELASVRMVATSTGVLILYRFPE